MKKKPLPLEYLPDYLRMLRDSGRSDEEVVVDMGRIVPESSVYPSLGRVLLYSFCLLLFSGGFYLMYDRSLERDVVIVLSSEREPAEVSEVVSVGGGRVVSLRRRGGFYEVEARTRNVESLLERLRGDFGGVEVR